MNSTKNSKPAVSRPASTAAPSDSMRRWPSPEATKANNEAMGKFHAAMLARSKAEQGKSPTPSTAGSFKERAEKRAKEIVANLNRRTASK